VKLNPLADAAGVIARAAAKASKAIENFFIIPPGVALAGVRSALALCREPVYGGATVSMAYTLLFKYQNPFLD